MKTGAIDWLPKMKKTENATMNHVARNIHRHETSSFSTCATSHGGGRTSSSFSLFLSLLPFSLFFLLLSLLLCSSFSLSVRTTHVQAIRYDWSDPRFRTNHFIKAVLNKPAFDYTPRHLVVIVSYTSPPFFAPCYRLVPLEQKRTIPVVYLPHRFHRNLVIFFALFMSIS